jgi:hypothetical protein
MSGRGGKRTTSFKRGQSGNLNGRPKLPTIIHDLRAAARESTWDALDTLKQVMEDMKAPCAARIAAANSILDRGWGKPKETIDATARFTLEDLVLASMRREQESEQG